LSKKHDADGIYNIWSCLQSIVCIYPLECVVLMLKFGRRLTVAEYINQYVWCLCGCLSWCITVNCNM